MPSLVKTIATLGLAATAAAQIDISGSGHISVLQSDNWTTASPDDSIGCLDATGRLTATDCAVFTRSGNVLSTELGPCTYHDEDEPHNDDSYYGQIDTAYTCGADMAPVTNDLLYTVNGFNYPFLCTADVDCYWDVQAAPEGDEQLPVWSYHWGSQQPGITPGHIKAILLWEKV
ncbi:hypothetical protein F4778DRAFT_530836 [Xylariomycetidae sp. FL2044]|nr:hypothetical protein F4778DRAFT_530836 [Xylariomycetidae sp. FL2044]